MDNNLLNPQKLASYGAASQPKPGALLTPQQLSSYAAGNAAKKDPSNPASSVGSSWDSFDQAASAPAPSYVHDTIASSFNAGKDKAVAGYNQAKNAKNPLDLLEGGTHLAAGAIEAAVSPLAPVTNIISAPIKAGVDYVADKISDIPAVQKFAASPAGEATSRIASDVGDLSTIAGTVAGGIKVPEVASAVEDSVKSTVGKISSAVDRSGPMTDSAVADSYNKAIKPSVGNKANASQVAEANSRAVSGLKSIAENKANLEFTDADGNVVKGETPKTVDQLSQSIDQTKKIIFQKYDALAKQAGEQGVTVDAPAISSELQPIVDSKALGIANPQAIEYAKSIQDRLNAAGPLDAQTAQDVIKHYNESLKAFYRNPSYETASQAGIDALVANKFREMLDKGISGATGEQYQALKNQYGALSSIEKDVARRAATIAKQSPVGFVANFSNIASGAELVNGLINLSPTHMAISGTIKGIQLLVKYLNDPNVGVSKIFKSFESNQK